MATENELNGKVLLNTNLKLRKSDEPQILIYHTHGSEAYRGKEERKKIRYCDRCWRCFNEEIGAKNIKVVHDRNIYDVKTEKRSDPRLIIMQRTAIEKNLKNIHPFRL